MTIITFSAGFGFITLESGHEDADLPIAKMTLANSFADAPEFDWVSATGAVALVAEFLLFLPVFLLFGLDFSVFLLFSAAFLFLLLSWLAIMLSKESEIEIKVFNSDSGTVRFFEIDKSEFLLFFKNEWNFFNDFSTGVHGAFTGVHARVYTWLVGSESL